LPITQGKVWGVTFVTPGAIALTAILVSYEYICEFGTTNIPKAIFLHSPDCEFAEVGAKSGIPYKNWFNLFKEFLMKNSDNSEIENLFKWWNGRVFSFDTANNQGVHANDVESGMDEAELVLAAGQIITDSEMSAQHENNNDEDIIASTLNNLSLYMQDGPIQPLSSRTVANSDPCASSSQTCHDSEPIIIQPDKSATQKPAGRSIRSSAQKEGRVKSNGKGKQKEVFIDEAAEELVGKEGPGTVNERSLRSRRK
jgi:hypothetical protein